MRMSDWSSDVCSSDLAHAVERAFERPRIGGEVGHQLGEPINLAVAHLEHAAGILEHRARLQFSEGDDLRDLIAAVFLLDVADQRSEEHTSELQSLMRISYAVFCLKKKIIHNKTQMQE